MKAKSKNNSNTFQGWLEAQLWNASLQPRSMVGAGNAVKGRDQLRCASPLTAFPAQCPRLSRFSLDTAVVVIDGMTWFTLWWLIKQDARERRLANKRLSENLCNPAAAHHDVAVVEDHSLARGDRPLRFVESYADFAITS